MKYIRDTVKCPCNCGQVIEVAIAVSERSIESPHDGV